MAGINPSARSSLLLFYHVIEDYLVRFISGREWTFYEHLRNLLGQQKAARIVEEQKKHERPRLGHASARTIYKRLVYSPVVFWKAKNREIVLLYPELRANNDNFFRQRLVESRHRFREEK